MTRIEIAILACRILALWVFTQCVLAIASLVYALLAMLGFMGSTSLAENSLIQFSTVYAVALMGLGLLLWFGSTRLARRMVSNDPTPVTRPDVTPSDLLAIGCILIGFITLVPAIGQISRSMIALLIGQNPHAEGVWSSASWQISFFGVIVQIVFSICLILGARNVSGWILRFRANRVNK